MPRYFYPNPRETVESQRELSIFWLNKQGFLPQDDGVQSIRVYWSANGKPVDDILVRINSHTNPTQHSSGYSYIRFVYKVKDPYEPESEYESVDYKYDLTRTKCNFGGYRWWFRCGAENGNEICNKRVGKLYLKDRHFACRTCANLSYESCNESRWQRRFPFSVSKYEEKAREAYEKISVPFYNGKPTKQMRQFLKYKNKKLNEMKKSPRGFMTNLPEIDDKSG